MEKTLKRVIVEAVDLVAIRLMLEAKGDARQGKAFGPEGWGSHER
jgi:hypothetical protein